MKKLHFQYEMELELDQEVQNHHFLIRCRPADTPVQVCTEFSCQIKPADSVTEVFDGFGNHGYAGSIRLPHRFFFVKAEGIVCTDFNNCRYSEECHPMYRYASDYTRSDDALDAFLKESEHLLGERIGCQKGLMFLMNRLYGRFAYVPGTTHTKTTAAEAFAGGMGVCQDYTHIFLCLCRLAGIPARYVAGMMLGEGATHAWAEVWLEDRWIGMDPTNHCLADETYIKLTHGRDFADGTVDKGCFLGFANQAQRIYVKVDEISDE